MQFRTLASKTCRVVLAVCHENTVHLMFYAPRCSHEALAAHRESFLLFLLSTSVEGHHMRPLCLFTKNKSRDTFWREVHAFLMSRRTSYYMPSSVSGQDEPKLAL